MKQESKKDVKKWLKERAEIFLQDIGVEKGQTVLDFGCNEGNYTIPAADLGKPFIYFNNKSQTLQALSNAFKPLLQFEKQIETNNKEHRKMRIAIPLFQGKLSLHFGHCEQFAIIDIDDDAKQITNRQDQSPPGYEPGVLPRWLNENNVSVIIAGGIGQRAQQLLSQSNIKVVVGASPGSPEELVSAYLDNTLEAGDNICDH